MKTILFAFLFDTFIGDPPNRYHPVAWMGSSIDYLRRWGRDSAVVQTSEGNQFIYGMLVACGGAGVMWWLGRLLNTLLSWLPAPLRWLAEAWILKTMFSLGGLTKAADEVRVALERDELDEARRLVSWHLVSRDTTQLDASQLAAATIESVGENLSDGVIAPLLYYRLFGLPGALAYRYVNTCDAMLGYRDEAREWLGKASARLDDLLNIIPARLTAILLLFAGSGMEAAEHGSESAQRKLQTAAVIWQRDSNQTDSPNAGHPMSATAGVLGISLEKVGQYNLGAGERRPEVGDIGRVVRLAQWATGFAVVVWWLMGPRSKADS